MAKPNRCSSAVHQVIYSRPCRLRDRGLFRNVVYGVAYLFVRFFLPQPRVRYVGNAVACTRDSLPALMIFPTINDRNEMFIRVLTDTKGYGAKSYPKCAL